VTSCLRIALAASALGAATAAAATAQVPPNLEAVELARSHECVGVLGRLDVLDQSLAPLALRSQRLLAIGEAVALEDDAVVDSLDVADPLESAVRAWFEADAALAARYVAQPSPELQEERTAAREAIKTRVGEAVVILQRQADSVIASTGDLQARAGRCAGAILVRGAVLESCGATVSPVCDAARDSATVDPTHRFVESAEGLWDLQELRAWTVPGGLTVTPDGQLGGARTVGATRLGNVAVTVAFSPWLQRRADLTPEAVARVDILTDSLGFGGDHPEVVFVPSLLFRATLPEPIGGETRYLFHFGPPEEADIVLVAGAATGVPLEGRVPLMPSHLARLAAGEPLTLTAVRDVADGQTDAVYAIELTSLNQGQAVGALAGYMASQLATDLRSLIPPGDTQSVLPAN